MGKQTYQVFEFVTVVLLECHLIVPIERGSVAIECHGREDHGGSEKWLLFGSSCKGFSLYGHQCFGHQVKTEMWTFTLRVWGSTNSQASTTLCQSHRNLSLLRYREQGGKGSGLMILALRFFLSKWMLFLKQFFFALSGKLKSIHIQLQNLETALNFLSRFIFWVAFSLSSFSFILPFLPFLFDSQFSDLCSNIRGS